MATAGAAAAWFVTRRPRGAQTSCYQPVRLLGLTRHGAERAAVVGFTSGAIAAEVRRRGGVAPAARVVVR